MAPRVALFAGTFDPVTFGHLDLMRRAAGLFDRLVVAVAREGKATWFTADERVALIAPHLAGLPGASVTTFDGLLVDFARAQGAKALIRGVRTFQDWEYELRMMQMNRYLAPDLETVFLRPPSSTRSSRPRWCGRWPRWAPTSRASCPANVVAALRDRSTRAGL